MTIEKQFDEKEELQKFLKSENGEILSIVGRRIFKRHCGERMLKLRSYLIEVLKNGNIELNKGCSYDYCIKCGIYNINH